MTARYSIAAAEAAATLASPEADGPSPPLAGEEVVVLDYGGQYSQLIARRVREAHVHSEIVPHTITAAEVRARRPAGVILSGGPASVHVASRSAGIRTAVSWAACPRAGAPARAP